MTNDTKAGECKHESNWFDRTICLREDGRERMATICNDCGKDLNVKAGEESKLKPCPFCGCTEDLVGECAKCDSYPIRLDQWNNAWAHKRIAELEPQVMGHLAYVNTTAQQIAALQARIAELERFCEVWNNKVTVYTNDIGALEKRNAELEVALSQTVYVPIKEYNAMQDKLETAEEALAAVTKERDSCRESLYEERDSH